MSKRTFDILFSFAILILFFWLIFIIWILTVIDTKTNGIFLQERIGQYGRVFKIFKFRTLKFDGKSGQQVASKLGRKLRKCKLDELPQLFNVLTGKMSVVGPRPDLSGYYDLLTGENKNILELKPGLTSAASLKYFDEERILQNQDNPQHYNNTVLFPDKVEMNLNYYYQRTFFGDLKIVVTTIKYIFFKI